MKFRYIILLTLIGLLSCKNDKNIVQRGIDSYNEFENKRKIKVDSLIGQIDSANMYIKLNDLIIQSLSDAGVQKNRDSISTLLLENQKYNRNLVKLKNEISKIDKTYIEQFQKGWQQEKELKKEALKKRD